MLTRSLLPEKSYFTNNFFFECKLLFLHILQMQLGQTADSTLIVASIGAGSNLMTLAKLHIF
jgi:hypothetical protein